MPRSELPALVTVDLALPTNCPAPTNQPLVVNTTCGAGNDMFGGVGCGYRFPGGECPRQCPAKACSADADCAADATHDGCRGPPMRCTGGRCTNGAAGGDMCVANGSAAAVLPRLRGGVVVQLNLETSVVGFAAVEVQRHGTAVPGYSLSESDPVQGNVLDAVASWGGARRASLSPLLGGGAVSLKIALTDAKLFAVRVVCGQ